MLTEGFTALFSVQVSFGGQDTVSTCLFFILNILHVFFRVLDLKSLEVEAESLVSVSTDLNIRVATGFRPKSVLQHNTHDSF